MRPFRSSVVSAFPSSVTCGIAFDPMMAELNSKLISRSIFGFELEIELIFSRSSVESERVGRLRKAAINRVSSAARAALAGDIVRPRVARGAFSAFTMSSAERCSAADADPDERANPTAKATPTKQAIAETLALFRLRATYGRRGQSPASQTGCQTRGWGRCDGHHEDGESPEHYAAIASPEVHQDEEVSSSAAVRGWLLGRTRL